jgi:hypothetical protein
LRQQHRTGPHGSFYLPATASGWAAPGWCLRAPGSMALGSEHGDAHCCGETQAAEGVVGGGTCSSEGTCCRTGERGISDCMPVGQAFLISYPAETLAPGRETRAAGPVSAGGSCVRRCLFCCPCRAGDPPVSPTIAIWASLGRDWASPFGWTISDGAPSFRPVHVASPLSG